MEYIIPLIIALGASLGAGAGTVVQVLFLQAVRDRVMDETERKMLHPVFTIIRVGMTLLMLGIILKVVSALAVIGPMGDHLIEVLTPDILGVVALLVFVKLNRWFIEKHITPMWFSTGWYLASWYGIFFLVNYPAASTLGLIPMLVGYAALLLFSCLLLAGIRKKFGIVLNR